MPLLIRAALLAVVAGYLVAAWRFGTEQSVWVDETTQLTGLGLSLPDLFVWLVGADGLAEGVPGDRMPPGSYLLGKLWATLFGAGETQMRLFGVIALLGALPALFATGRRLGGGLAGLFAVGAVFLSAQIVVTANEIRAYPFFLVASSWLVHAFVILVMDPVSRHRPAALAGFATAALACCYLHFFGCVATFVLGSILLVVATAERDGVRPVLLLGAGIAVASLGLVPFVLAALDMSSSGAGTATPSIAESVRDGVRLAFRLVASPPMLIFRPVLLIALVSAAVIVLLALWRAVRAPGVRQSRAILALTAALALAFVLLVGLATTIDGFDVLAPHYNIWMLPVFAALMSAALARSSLPAMAAAAGLVAANLAGTALLVRHAPLYTHGPEDWIAGQIAAPEETRILHDARGSWGSTYFSLFLRYGNDLEQYLQHPDGRVERITSHGVVPLAPEAAAVAATGSFGVTVQGMSSRELASIARGESSCEVTPNLAPNGGTVLYRCAFFAAALHVPED